jgi:serine/threonine protein phosphatase PrpC
VSGHVFISYGRDDTPYVRRLAARLTRLEIPAWYDDGIEPGDRWTDVIAEQIETCGTFVVVMSPSSGRSRWVKREIIHAEQSSRRIVPLLLRGTVFFEMNDRQYVDARDDRVPPDDVLRGWRPGRFGPVLGKPRPASRPRGVDRSRMYGTAAAESGRGLRVPWLPSPAYAAWSEHQDAAYAGPRLIAVAGGRGGGGVGDAASRIAITALAPLDLEDVGDNVSGVLRDAVELADSRIRDAVRASPHLQATASSLTAMVFSSDRIGLAHIGNTRAYLLRAGELTQLTMDDTVAQASIDDGRAGSDDAHRHPLSDLVIRALNLSDAEATYSVLRAEPGDRVLLCSDGVSRALGPETIASALAEYRDPEKCVAHLVQLAKRADGRYAVTAVVTDVDARPRSFRPSPSPQL